MVGWITSGIIIVVLATALVVWLSVKAHRGKVSAGREDLLGRTAVVDVSLDPKGVVLVEGERWTAISEDGTIPAEAEVVIKKVQGLKLWVTKK